MSDDRIDPEINLENFQSVMSEILDQVVSATGVADKADLTLPDNPVTPGSRVPDAEQWATKQVTRARAAGPDWLYGVLHPRKNPVEAAIAANAKRKQKLAQAEQEERWLHSMERVDIGNV